jgi:hypothetical protein
VAREPNAYCKVFKIRKWECSSSLSGHIWASLYKWPIGRHRILFSHHIPRLLDNSTSTTFRNSIQFLFVDRYASADS